MRFLVIASVLIALAGGWLYFSSRTPTRDGQESSPLPTQNTNIDTAQPDGTIIKPDGTVIRPSTNSSSAVDPTSQPGQSSTTAQYLTYTTENFDSAKAAVATSGGRLLLYFHVDWSSVCVELDQDIAASVHDLPGDLIILRADFEEDTALRQAYDVQHEHTFVQVDSQGNKLTAWLASSNAGDIPSHLK
jgi:hypothetical protein